MPRRTVNVGLRNAAIMNGEEDLSVWDDEELKRGRRRDKHGGWRGKDPKVVPKAIHDEWVKRKFAKAYERLADSLEDGAEALHEIFSDKLTPPADRIKAIDVMFNRVLGKPTENISFAAAMEPSPLAPWQTAILDSIVSVPVDRPAGAIEAEGRDASTDQ